MYKPKLPPNIDALTWVGPDEKICIESGLIHCVRIPPEATRSHPMPMVVMVHGWGGDESSMWIFKQTLPSGVAVITPRAPLELTEDGFVWFKETSLQPSLHSLTDAVNTFEKFLINLPRFYPVNPRHLVLMGFSQGAFISNAFTLTHPSDVIGVVSLAGAMPSMPQEDHHPNLLAGLPVFIAHGLRDNTIPIDAARQARNEYHALGADITYGEYPVAHKMTPQAIKDLKIWLAKLF